MIDDTHALSLLTPFGIVKDVQRKAAGIIVARFLYEEDALAAVENLNDGEVFGEVITAEIAKKEVDLPPTHEYTQSAVWNSKP